MYFDALIRGRMMRLCGLGVLGLLVATFCGPGVQADSITPMESPSLVVLDLPAGDLTATVTSLPPGMVLGGTVMAAMISPVPSLPVEADEAGGKSFQPRFHPTWIFNPANQGSPEVMLLAPQFHPQFHPILRQQNNEVVQISEPSTLLLLVTGLLMGGGVLARQVKQVKVTG